MNKFFIQLQVVLTSSSKVNLKERVIFYFENNSLLFRELIYLKWYVINKDYVNYLKKYDKFVLHIEYKNKMKCFLGIVLNKVFRTFNII